MYYEAQSNQIKSDIHMYLKIPNHSETWKQHKYKSNYTCYFVIHLTYQNLKTSCLEKANKTRSKS